MTDWTPTSPTPPPGRSGGPSGPRASFLIRLGGYLVDGVILFVMQAILALALKGVGQGLGTLLGIAYFVYLDGSPSGQTIGKRMVGIRVIDFGTGGPIGYGRALVRWLVGIVAALACLIGYFWMLWDPERQTWFDKAANSVVVPTSAYPVAAWPG